MDLVLMGIPRHLAQEVADVIASDTVSIDTGAAATLTNGWTEERLRRAYRESKDNMRKLLEHLAAHPDQEFGTPEIADAIGAPDWNSIAGMLGPFTRRYKGRYRMGMPPWVKRTDSADRDHLRMPADAAAIVRDEAGI
jgi:hypothetical protein